MSKRRAPAVSDLLAGCAVMIVNAGSTQRKIWSEMVEQNGGEVVPTPMLFVGEVLNSGWPEGLTHVVVGGNAVSGGSLRNTAHYPTLPPPSVSVVLHLWLTESVRKNKRLVEAGYSGLLQPPGQAETETESDAPPAAKKSRTSLGPALPQAKVSIQAMTSKTDVLKPLLPKLPSCIELVKPPGAKGHLYKDNWKARCATKYIGRGTPGSSTDIYEKCYGPELANTGVYCASDVVFVSINGSRSSRVKLDETEVDKAAAAGAVIVADCAKMRRADQYPGKYNSGERELANLLPHRGYVELSDTGTWVPRDGIQRYLNKYQGFLVDQKIWNELNKWLRDNGLIN